MKICFVTHTIFSLGGIQRVLSVVASSLSKYHDITIICSDNSFKIDKNIYNLSNDVKIEMELNLIKKSNLYNRVFNKIIREINEIYNIKINERILYNAYYRYDKDKLLNFINENKFDVVIGVDGNFSLLLGRIAENINAKTIGWQHNSYDAYLKEPKRYFWKQDNLFRKYLPKLDKCIVLTNSDKEKYLQNLNVATNVIYNPLSFSSELKSKCIDKQIIFVGRLEKEQKGIDLLLDAFKIVAKQNNEWSLKIVGDGPDRKEIEEYVRKMKLEERVVLLGKSNDVKTHYLASSIFVSSSRWEGFGLVITEAMECGLPIIAFDNSGPIEIVNKNNVNGILVEKGNVHELARRILYLIDDYDLRIKMSKQSIKRAADFNAEKIINKWESLIEKVK